jgi:hypothetical protein
MATTNVKILLRRGLRKDVSAGTLETGEMGFTTDTNQLYVGIDPAINEVQFDPFTNAQAVVQSWLDSDDNPEPGLTIDEDLVIRNVTDVDGLMDAMNFFAQIVTFDTITQTFTPGDTLNQKYNKNLDATFETRTTAEIVSASVGPSSTVVTLKINETQPSLRKEEDFSVVLTNQNTGGNTLGGVTVTDPKLKDRWHSPISVDVDNGVDAVYQLTLANNDYLYSFNETTKEGTINFTTPISDGQTTTEQVDTTETITADGSETQFNLLNFPDPAPSSIELKVATYNLFKYDGTAWVSETINVVNTGSIPDNTQYNAGSFAVVTTDPENATYWYKPSTFWIQLNDPNFTNDVQYTTTPPTTQLDGTALEVDDIYISENINLLTTPTDYEIYDQNHPNYNGTVEEIKFAVAPTVNALISYKEIITDDQNDLIESLTVNFSDDANFYFETVDTTNTITDLSSINVSKITGDSQFGVSQYAVPRTNVEVVTENTFNQMFADQHLTIFDVTDGKRSSLFRKSLPGLEGNFLRYNKNECSTFFIDYSLKQEQSGTSLTFVRVGTLKVINGVPQNINKIKITDDNTEIWQDLIADNIADVDEFSNIEFKSKIEDVIRVNSSTIADVKEWLAPSDKTETFSATAGQTVFTIAETLDPAGYEIDSVVVGNTVYAQTTDWTVSGQDITFINPTMVGGETVKVKLKYSLTSPNKPYALAYSQGLFKIDNEAGATGNVIVRYKLPVWDHATIVTEMTNDVAFTPTVVSIEGDNILIHYTQDNGFNSEISYTVKRWTM